MKFVFVYITYPLSPSSKNDSFFIHCVDSHLKENGKWYSRFHIGPFTTGSSLQIGTRFRRSLHNDLIQVFVSRIELDGVTHEFARLTGVYDPILELLFQFRKVALYAPFLKKSETIITPILIFGSGTFYAKDIRWPSGVECSNPHLLLFTLAKGRIIRGHVIIQKNGLLRYVAVVGEPLVSKNLGK
jgi:DNA-directed RNA polymerase alpha subunit